MVAFLSCSIGVIALFLSVLVAPAYPSSAGVPGSSTSQSASEVGEKGGADVIPKSEFEAAMTDLQAQNVARRFAQADSAASVLLAEIQVGGGSGSLQESSAALSRAPLPCEGRSSSIRP